MEEAESKEAGRKKEGNIVSTVPPTFEWVKARASCSLAQVFKDLELGAKADVDVMKKLYPHEANSFFITSGRSLFSVNRITDTMTSASQSVDFELSKEITIRDGDKCLHAGITLNNDGQCKLKIADAELDEWQVRRMALERLFFGPL
jgi:hypothetical protein